MDYYVYRVLIIVNYIQVSFQMSLAYHVFNVKMDIFYNKMPVLQGQYKTVPSIRAQMFVLNVKINTTQLQGNRVKNHYQYKIVLSMEDKVVIALMFVKHAQIIHIIFKSFLNVKI